MNAPVGTTFCRAESTLTTDEEIPMPDNTESATLNYPGGELDLEIVPATEGADGIALGSLLAKTGYTTYDEGFVNTAARRFAASAPRPVCPVATLVSASAPRLRAAMVSSSDGAGRGLAPSAGPSAFASFWIIASFCC